MRRMILGLAAAAIGLSAMACSSSSGGTGGTLADTNWKLTSYASSGSMTNVPAGVVVDAHFTSDRVSGSAGCNLYNGSATVSGAKLTIGKLVSTQMACQDPAQTVETAYLAALPTAATFTATADALTIFDSNGKQILVYAKGAANPLEGSWDVTGYNNGKQAVTSPIAGTTLTAIFTPDGQVSGDGGCNTYNGPYTLDGTSLTVGPLMSTKKACDQAIMDQETQFLTALQTPTTVETSGATVTLRDASGAMQVLLAPAAQ